MLWENTDHSASETTLQYTMEPKEFENRFLPYDVLTNIAHMTILNRRDFVTDELCAQQSALAGLPAMTDPAALRSSGYVVTTLETALYDALSA
ncbi:MAG: hypothetical protein RI568_08170, partial [Natronomonas sp.]